MGIFDHARNGVNSPFNTATTGGGGGGTPTGDPNTVAFFGASGDLTDQVDWTWDGTTQTFPSTAVITGVDDFTVLAQAGSLTLEADGGNVSLISSGGSVISTADNGYSFTTLGGTFVAQAPSVILSNGTSTATWDGTNFTIQGHLAAGTTNTYDIGLSASNIFRSARFRTVFVNDGTTGQMRVDAITGQTVPSGDSISASVNMQQTATHMGIYTANNSANNATVTGDIYIQTGNKTVGTANSGSIWLRPGTATGTRGKIRKTDGTEGTTGHVWTSTDVNGNGRWSAPNATPSFATTATAGGTTTLTSASATVQEFTGASAQTLRLPNATTLTAGQQYWVANRSTGTITVQLNDATTTLLLVRANSQAIIILSSNGTSNGTWNSSHFNAGNVVSNITWATGNTSVIDFNTSGGGTATVGPGSGSGRVSINASSSLEYTGGGIQFQTAGSSIYLASGGDVRAPGDLKIAPGLATGSGTVGNANFSNTHVMFSSANGTATVPSIAALAAAGTGATAALATGQRDAVGQFSVTTGTTSTSGAQADITFQTAYTNSPFVQISPADANAASIAASTYVTATTSKFTLNFSTAPTDATTYTFNYFVAGRV